MAVPKRAPNRSDQEIIAPPQCIQRAAHLAQGGPLQGHHKRQNLPRLLFELVALQQTFDFFLDVTQLPNFRNIDAQPAKSLTDVADDAGAILDHEADVKRYFDIIFALQLQRSQRNQAGRAWQLPLAARQFTDVTEHRHRSRAAAGPRANEDVVAIAFAAPRTAALAGKTDGIGRAIDAGEKVVAPDQRRRDKNLHGMAGAARHRQLFDRARANALSVTKIHRLDIFDALAPNLSGLDLQAEADQAHHQQFRFGIAPVD